MIWFEATQSDQPEMTWMSSLTSSPFGSTSLLPLYLKPAPVRSFFAADGLYFAMSCACFFTAGFDTQLGKRPFRPIASVGGA